MGDLIGSAAVIVAAIIIVTTGWMQADAIASLFIAAMIIPRAISLLREVVSVLSESTPKGMHVTEIRDHILDDPGCRGLSTTCTCGSSPAERRCSPRTSSSTPAALTDGKAGAILQRLQSCLSEHFDVEHSTFQLEPAGHVEHDAHA